jgi:hypothetical protein
MGNKCTCDDANGANGANDKINDTSPTVNSWNISKYANPQDVQQHIDSIATINYISELISGELVTPKQKEKREERRKEREKREEKREERRRKRKLIKKCKELIHKKNFLKGCGFGSKKR